VAGDAFGLLDAQRTIFGSALPTAQKMLLLAILELFADWGWPSLHSIRVGLLHGANGYAVMVVYLDPAAVRRAGTSGW